MADFNLECFDARWTKYALINIACILIYPVTAPRFSSTTDILCGFVKVGVPLVFMFLLWRVRKNYLYVSPFIRYNYGFLYEVRCNNRPSF